MRIPLAGWARWVAEMPAPDALDLARGRVAIVRRYVGRLALPAVEIDDIDAAPPEVITAASRFLTGFGTKPTMTTLAYGGVALRADGLPVLDAGFVVADRDSSQVTSAVRLFTDPQGARCDDVLVAVLASDRGEPLAALRARIARPEPRAELAHVIDRAMAQALTTLAVACGKRSNVRLAGGAKEIARRLGPMGRYR